MTKEQKDRAKYWKANAHRINTQVRTRPEARYKALRARCAREGRKFRMSLSAYVEKLEGGCHYCGANLMKEVGGNVDRRNNDNVNYTTLSTVACCADCNKVKSDRLTEQEMLVGMAAIVKYRKKVSNA